MRILFASGGSGGHLSPLVAVAQTLKENNSSHEIHVLCSTKPGDAEFLAHEKFSFTQAPYPRGLRWPLDYFQNRKIVKELIQTFKPDAVFSTGGAVSIATCVLAHKKNIPVILYQADSVMGRANTWLSRYATKICCGLPLQSNISKRFILTGHPLRINVTKGNRTEGLKITGLTGTRPILLVTGGSQGARVFNEAIIHHLPELLKFCDIIHLTGKGKGGADAQKGYWPLPFAYNELPHLYAIADLALSRAGASNIAELAANNIPTILVPIQGLAHDHQFKNATTAQENGGCILLLQQELDKKLVDTVHGIVKNDVQRAKMQQMMRKLYQPDASRHIAEIIVGCIA